ncbi:membrane protein insertase YidC [Candidatus Deianiraea vastatrix]|uniref:Membrane protein insertase YidC n=1 Tax=Candidatus Deianiraea vastatrix TaxID=2163644 RepID=A0A5B8XC99_9RICK|nr:membrane protein insertase YidC [Candidatus Deianiraea vastatrix]QED22890.1 Membrane protein insertase YidC [Candidatus Deianiraea vastatrix]
MNTQLEQMQQIKRLVLVSAICMFILMFFSDNGKKQNVKDVKKTTTNAQTEEKNNKVVKFKSRDEAIQQRNSEKQIKFENESISGSISLKGLKIDDLTLKNYLQDEDKTKNVNILSPVSAPNYYYIDFGWTGENVPNKDTIWNVQKNENQMIFTANISSNIFKVVMQMQEKYLWKIEMSNSQKNNKLNPYIRIRRSINDLKQSATNIHEGIILVKDSILKEEKYSDINNRISLDTTSKSWIGFGDKYWFSGIISTNSSQKTISYGTISDCKKCYQIDIISDENGEKAEFMIYSGAKEFDEIKSNEEKYSIPLFDRVIDFGWFYFLTKPILILIKFLYNLVGNFGIAIIMLTVFIRILLFPLAHKSYKSMAKLKVVTPKIKELKERFGSDKKAFNMAIVNLYKEEKVNPAAGCLPMFLQIPVFFALYKVLIVAIEMRDAPFALWIVDLSERDPTSIFNLFGLLGFHVPAFLQIGILPIFMGFTLYLQQKFSPQPADPTQARMMKILPPLFTILFASFPSGLVLYWSINNLISILQQWIVARNSKS